MTLSVTQRERSVLASGGSAPVDDQSCFRQTTSLEHHPFTVYDNQTRSMLDTPQRYPRAGGQSYPSPAAESNADGSTTVHFGPRQPDGVKRGNWIQTLPGKGWFTILRLYSPLEPLFDKSWRPTEIELVP
jgi:hypothetical protein